MKKYFVAFGAVLVALAFGRSGLAATASEIIPNDTFYGVEWYADAMRLPEAWNMASTTKHEVVVAVVDGGVDFAHPDLRGALWTDPDEIPNNGVDDDGDGYIDDAHGWNFVTNASATRPLTSLFLNDGAWEHGTAVSSLVAGRGNDDIGMAGVAWTAKIMPVVILGADGQGGTDRLVKAIDYAVAHRADIINLSVEGTDKDPDVTEAIRQATAKGVLVVVAAGNGPDGQGTDMDATPLYPSCEKGSANVGMLTVSGVMEDGARNASANYGACVSIAAPGAQIMAAKPTYDPDGNRTEVSGYAVYSGTSLSAPLVSGVAALVKAQHPEWSGEQIAERLAQTAKKFPPGVTGMGSGLVDAAAALGFADPKVYGPWNLFASETGKPPHVYVTDANGKTIYDLQVGDAGDKRGYRAALVHWDEDRRPDILVTAKGDESGAWRVYRTDGVLLAAGQVSRDVYDRIKGGLLLAAQDIDAVNRERVLFAEAAGSRVWFMTPGKALEEPIVMSESAKPLGSMAVGLQRPSQAFVSLTREAAGSRLSILDLKGVEPGTYVSTTRPQALDMVAGRQADGREVVRLTQSGPPTYLVEKSGSLKPAKSAAVTRWKQAPQGLFLFGFKDKRFYDSWPR